MVVMMQMVVADCVITNWRDYGVFAHDSSAVPGARMAFVGARIQQHVDAHALGASH